MNGKKEKKKKKKEKNCSYTNDRPFCVNLSFKERETAKVDIVDVHVHIFSSTLYYIIVMQMSNYVLSHSS